jgi:hypothetical protein
MMNHYGAFWIATFPICGALGNQMHNLGDVTLDVALAVLQLAVPLDHSRHMARLYDLAGPYRRIDLSSSGANFSVHYRRGREPGLGLAEGMLHHYLAQAETLISAGGRHVNALATGLFELRGLQQSWCDAVYWFRQGAREHLDSIAVTKFQTAIEVFLAAGSTHANRKRQAELIYAYYGRSHEEYINPNSELTVKQFVNDIITNRSRLLHGNWSTLASPMAANRGQLESFARTVLATAAVQLSLYIDAGGRDNISQFIAWSGRNQKKPQGEERA